MRRLLALLSVVAVVLLAILAVGRSGPGTAAQDATPAAMGGHPVVGAWLLIDDAFPDDPPVLVHLHADGTYLQVDADGTVGVGAWEATGERGAAVTFVQQFADETGAVSTITIRAEGEVDAGGDTFTASYTIELALPDGTSQGEFGPGTVTATRIAVEPIGTPVGPLEALFGPPEDATPETGTPAP